MNGIIGPKFSETISQIRIGVTSIIITALKECFQHSLIFLKMLQENAYKKEKISFVVIKKNYGSTKMDNC